MNTARRAGLSGRSRKNDAVILDAATHLASSEGWAGLTPGHISQTTGLARPTVLQRYADRAAVGTAVWRHIVPSTTRALEGLVAAGTAERVQVSSLTSGFEPFVHPNEDMQAAAELLVVASYVPDVAIAVAETLGPWFTRWFTAGRKSDDRARAAQHALLVAMAFGYVLDSRRLADIPFTLDDEMDRLAQALSSPTTPARLPAARARHFDRPITFETGDRTWDSVLRATLECVGEFGYEAATIEVIAARSGYTRTAIFSRYATKQDLFLDASNRMLAGVAGPNIEYQKSVGRNQPAGIPDTCFLREVARPERHRLRTITLEQVRLAAHSEQLQVSIREAAGQFEELMTARNPEASPANIRAKLITELAISTGMGALAQVTELIWNLPFDVILVPWRAEEEQQS